MSESDKVDNNKKISIDNVEHAIINPTPSGTRSMSDEEARAELDILNLRRKELESDARALFQLQKEQRGLYRSDLHSYLETAKVVEQKREEIRYSSKLPAEDIASSNDPSREVLVEKFKRYKSEGGSLGVRWRVLIAVIILLIGVVLFGLSS